MKIIEEKQNPLLKRKEIKVILEADKNPTEQEAIKEIAGKFKVEEGVIAVKQVKGKFGRNTFLITANIYESPEDRERVEPKVKGKKGEEKKRTISRATS
jgi:ribosomal protein S24E